MKQLAKFCRDNADKWVRIPIYSKVIKPSECEMNRVLKI